MKVFILAGGLGTRLKSATSFAPKVMIKIGNKPVLEHLINLCVHHRLTDIVIGLHYLPKIITSYFQDGSKFNCHLNYSIETTPMGGAGAIKHAQKLLGNKRFLVFNGDVLTNLNLIKFSQFHQQKKGLASFLVHQTDHPYDSDIVEYNDDFLITNFFRPNVTDKFKPISKTGAHIFEPGIFKYIPVNQNYSLEKQLIPKLLKKNEKLYAYYSDCYSKDMGTPDRLDMVRKDLKDGKIKF